jgi:hypothetical protein
VHRPHRVFRPWAATRGSLLSDCKTRLRAQSYRFSARRVNFRKTPPVLAEGNQFTFTEGTRVKSLQLYCMEYPSFEIVMRAVLPGSTPSELLATAFALGVM